MKNQTAWWKRSKGIFNKKKPNYKAAKKEACVRPEPNTSCILLASAWVAACCCPEAPDGTADICKTRLRFSLLLLSTRASCHLSCSESPTPAVSSPQFQVFQQAAVALFRCYRSGRILLLRLFFNPFFLIETIKKLFSHQNNCSEFQLSHHSVPLLD